MVDRLVQVGKLCVKCNRFAVRFGKEADMARIFVGVMLVAAAVVVAGCGGPIEGRGQLMPARTSSSIAQAPTLELAEAGELDLVEQMAMNRQAYRQGLELLADFYRKRGNEMKLSWAEKELEALNSMPQYRYVIQAEVAGPQLSASRSIPDADNLYKDAVETYNDAKLLVFADNQKLRIALDKFNRLISQYPASDKIDDAAYYAGEVYRHFRDWNIALLYYKRAFQWDSQTPYPARYRAARILDFQLHERDEALELYREAVEKESRYYEYIETAQKRIAELTKSDEQQ